MQNKFVIIEKIKKHRKCPALPISYRHPLVLFDNEYRPWELGTFGTFEFFK